MTRCNKNYLYGAMKKYTNSDDYRYTKYMHEEQEKFMGYDDESYRNLVYVNIGQSDGPLLVIKCN